MKSAKQIEKLLTQALLYDGEMDYGLYEYELEEQMEKMWASLIEDRDEHIFAVTENSGHVAMLLLETTGDEYINEDARERLKMLWPDAAYDYNLKLLIPTLAVQLKNEVIPFTGVKFAQEDLTS
jgi:hypothetical protein